jgi:Domain of unknown function (DUF1707)
MDEQLRIGDAERERAAADLGDHYAQGRLTVEEHAERLDRIWAARTRADLGPIFADLPGPAVAAAPERVRRRTGRPPRFPLLPLLVVVVVLAAVTPVPWPVGLVVLPLVAFVVVRRATWSRCGR